MCVRVCVCMCFFFVFYYRLDICIYTLQLRRHEGPVWQVAWAHPKFGNILASCSYDTRVIIWRELNGQWVVVKDHAFHTSSGFVYDALF